MTNKVEIILILHVVPIYVTFRTTMKQVCKHRRKGYDLIPLFNAYKQGSNLSRVKAIEANT